MHHKNRVLNHQFRVGLQKHISSLKRNPSAAEKAELLERRRRLMLRITSFDRKGSTFLNLDENVNWIDDVGGEAEDDDDSPYSKDSKTEEVPEKLPETQSLALPSSLAPGKIDRLGIVDLARQEATL